ncbi:LOW QUALITY PROTEIN: hypothetical protein Cgig2_032816 [Carnegiea gigantea]|uniref:Uncharacterized protein n=1 Tax=Carnegiea gigantea TaxID=171969 RepID=A0A9Q1GFN8_9CARY|nr:LOW QUALITY PROTEIN: hypothetical protein Cgig2_032816 [Carnegiea gigantea]
MLMFTNNNKFTKTNWSSFRELSMKNLVAWIYKNKRRNKALHTYFRVISCIDQATNIDELDCSRRSKHKILLCQNETKMNAPLIYSLYDARVRLEVTDQHVRDGILNIPNIKSLRLNRHTNGFFKTYRREVGPMVYDAVKEFFSVSRIPEVWNSTMLVVLHKASTPIQASGL